LVVILELFLKIFSKTKNIIVVSHFSPYLGVKVYSNII
jgi:hypothetical protein